MYLFLGAVTLFVAYTHAFYLPGLAPVVYCDSTVTDKKCKHDLKIFVNRLKSVETVLPYEYNSFDFCTDDDNDSPTLNLGQILMGDRIRPSPYNMKFNQPINCKSVCMKDYAKGDKDKSKKLKLLKKGILLNYNHYWIVDNMPLTWCYDVENGQKYCSTGFPIGCYVDKNGKQKDACVISNKYSESNTYYVFNHLDITISYHSGYNTDWGEELGWNGGRIVAAKLEPRSIKHRRPGDCSDTNPVMGIRGDVEDVSFNYTYSVTWQENDDIKWSSRWDYIFKPLPSTNIIWFSFVNSLVIVMFLSGVVAMVMLRTLHKDIDRYNEMENIEEYAKGWIMILGDVFRPPRQGMLFAVLIGNGVQIFCVALITLVFACAGFLSPANRGALMTCALISYVCLGSPAGYVSARLYKTFGGDKLKTNTILTAFSCSGIVFGVFFVLNILLWAKESSAAIPIGTLIALLALWLGISVPLVFVGAHYGYKKKAIEHSLKPNQVPRDIPDQSLCKKIYTKPIPGIIMGGVLPFGCIFIQIFFILNSIWSHQIHYMFGALLLDFTILLITCSEATILLCYFHLCAQDYHWWWRSFLTSGFTAVYAFMYCIHYFVNKLEIHDSASCFLYFGYTFIMVFLFFLLTGTIGFFACFWFVTRMHNIFNVKVVKKQYLDVISVIDTVPLPEKTDSK